jgi:ABC-2 type transport system permease protein
MIQSLRRDFSIYSAIAAMAVKTRLAYNMWVWADFVVTLVSMIVFVYFWRAVYAGTSTLGGLALSQTITYILLARLLSPLIEMRTIFFFGFMIRQGQIAVELTRPLDMQVRIMTETFAELLAFLVQRLPLFLLAWLLFGMHLPADPLLWLAFFVSLGLGQAVLFLFDWMFACLAFYTTETWGLSVVRIAVGSFFCGAIVPLMMMPGWLQKLAAVMPFAQAIAVPVSFLSGISAFADAPRIWLIQLIWVVILLVLSRLVFRVAIRTVTVQGG